MSGLIRQVADVGFFKGYSVRDSRLVVSHMQYVDDILLIGMPMVQNLCTMKAVQRCFELALGSKVKFSKSSIFRVNVSPLFLYLAEGFLQYCKRGDVSF